MPAAPQRKTPGVYVTELSAFPPSVVGVETAVPAFVGYTKRAELNGRPVWHQPVQITSYADYEAIFGPTDGTDDPPATFKLTAATAGAAYDLTIGGANYTVDRDASTPKFYLAQSIQLFFANGGGTCYVVSVGPYAATGVVLKDLQDGLQAIRDQVGPTMLVVPDAMRLPPEANTTTCAAFGTVVQQMLQQCHDLGDRVAILDIWGADTLDASKPDPGQATMRGLVSEFRDHYTGTSNLSYGMAYFPCLRTGIVQATDIDYTNLEITALQDALKAEAHAVYGTDESKDPAKTVITKIAALATEKDSAKKKALNQDLSAALPVLKQLYGLVANKVNILPASGAMAGIYTQVDATRGVWNAPANISLTSVAGPNYKITGDVQEDLNVPIEGKAVNAIRDFVGRGTLVWGARTLDGNSNDYRYIQVRRTLVYIEQSIKDALNQFVFAPNDAHTWVNVTAMISNFLTGLWTQGGLMGAKANEAFTVQCGLGSTMTGLDVLNGYMRVQVTLQMIHPAEFIELTFTQKMQGVG